jgi:hypothetical protein
MIPLRVEAELPETFIFVIDGDFRRVAEGQGRLETELPPGLYTVKLKAGTGIHEENIALMPQSGPVYVMPTAAVSFKSSAPLYQTSALREPHESPARELGRKVQRRLGEGAELFVFVRDLEDRSALSPANGLCIHDAQGDEVLDLGLEAMAEPSEQWAGINLALDPGSYRLRLRTDVAGDLEQALVLSPGWQTQIFLLRQSFGYTRKVRRADLSSAAIFMARPGLGFEPDARSLRRVELARLGLVSGKPVVPTETLRELLEAKAEDPMLGILGLHSLLLEDRPDIGLAAEVAAHLADLLPGHPDVDALGLAVAARQGRAPAPGLRFDQPPMLRRSWSFVDAAATELPGLIPADSLAAQVAGRLWGESAWTIWSGVPEREEKRGGGRAGGRRKKRA